MKTNKIKPNYHFKIRYNAKNPDDSVCTLKINRPDLKALVFKGGGSRSIVYNKFIQELSERGILNQIEEVGGSSSGAIAALFSAIPYNDPETRSEAVEGLNRINRADVYNKASGWKVYRLLTSPLQLVSTPLSWLSKGINWVASKLNNYLPGKILGYPLKLISGVLGLASTLTNPRFYAGAFNLLTKGGIYYGNEIQNYLRRQIRKDAGTAIKEILANAPDEITRKQIKSQLLQHGVVKAKKNKLRKRTYYTLNFNLTFAHLRVLANLPNSQFKELFVTAVRKRGMRFRIFNTDNTPDMPLHQAVRHAITLPIYYKPKSYKGEAYLDGGMRDNSPVTHTKKRKLSNLSQKLRVNQDEVVLSARVEYPHQYQVNMEPPKPLTKRQRFWQRIKKHLYEFFVGLDILTPDDEVTRVMRTRFKDQTVQLPDFGIKIVAEKVDQDTKSKINKTIPNLLNSYQVINRHDVSKKKEYLVKQSARLGDLLSPADASEARPISKKLFNRKLYKTLLSTGAVDKIRIKHSKGNAAHSHKAVRKIIFSKLASAGVSDDYQRHFMKKHT